MSCIPHFIISGNLCLDVVKMNKIPHPTTLFIHVTINFLAVRSSVWTLNCDRPWLKLSSRVLREAVAVDCYQATLSTCRQCIVFEEMARTKQTAAA
jgi:hypothetical protein